MPRRALPLLAVSCLLLAAVAPAAGAAPEPSPALAVDLPETVNLAGVGLVPAVILTSEEVDAAAVDVSTVRLEGTRPAEEDGSPMTRRVDADDDGDEDLIVYFEKSELTANGDLGPDADELTLTASTTDGRPLAGTDDVSPTVTLEVKFDESLRVRGSDRTLRSERGRSLGRVRAALDRQGGAELDPALDPATARRLEERVAETSLTEASDVPDLASWYQVTLPADADVDEALAELSALPEIEHAYPAPEPVPPPQVSSTPDFTSLQGYFGPAPLGIDADFSRQDPRIRGAGITIVDLEYDWNENHEDLQLDYETNLGGTTFLRYPDFGDDHGTAVFGELVALDNGYGVTGGVPDAKLYGISPTRAPSYSWQPGPALAYLASLDLLKPGDVVLLEQQTSSPLGGSRYAPLEWVASVYEANVVLNSMGVNVVSTGGNGNTDTDDPMYTRNGQPWFDPDLRHSGAIYVGAGSSTTRERLSFSNYGRRFDLQAWGQNITTTGYCTLLCTDDHNVRYTNSFSGTSGAGPIVTAAVVAIQSYLKATGQEPWTATQVADLLKATGTPQGPNTAAQHIGPLPNLRAALLEIEVDAPTTEAEVAYEAEAPPGSGRLVKPIVTLSADDGWGTGVERTEYRVNGGAWRTYDEPVKVDGNGQRVIEFRSIDGNGNVEQTRSVSFFALGKHD